MTDTRNELPAERAEPLGGLVADLISEHVVGDAPPDYEQLMEETPVYSGRTRILCLVAALTALWSLIIAVGIAAFTKHGV